MSLHMSRFPPTYIEWEGLGIPKIDHCYFFRRHNIIGKVVNRFEKTDRAPTTVALMLMLPGSLVKVPSKVLGPDKTREGTITLYLDEVTGEGMVRLVGDGMQWEVPVQELCDAWNEWQEPNFMGEGI
jgi:hypothetical protein